MKTWIKETTMSFRIWHNKKKEKIRHFFVWKKIQIAMKIRQLRCNHQWRFTIECIATGKYKIRCTKCGKLKKDLTRAKCQL